MKQQIDVVNCVDLDDRVGGPMPIVMSDEDFANIETEHYSISSHAQAKLQILVELFDGAALSSDSRPPGMSVEEHFRIVRGTALILGEAIESFAKMRELFDKIDRHRSGQERGKKR